jgi:hypothetical protein
MKKVNDKSSQIKAKRAKKKVKRLKSKVRLSKQQRREQTIRNKIVSNFLGSVNVAQD